MDSSAHEKVNPGDTSGLLLCTTANTSEGAASLGSKAHGLSGAGRQTASFALGSDDEALSVGTGGAAESFSAISSILRSNRSPCSTRGVRDLLISWTALHCTPGGILNQTVHL